MTDNIVKFPIPEKESEFYRPEYEAVLNAVDELTWDEREDLFIYLWFNGHAPLSY